MTRLDRRLSLACLCSRTQEPAPPILLASRNGLRPLVDTRLFSQQVGDSGWVYAVDIAPKFIQHIHKTSSEQNLSNITGVLCREDSVDLAPQTVDKVYVCDTYHHFEYPAATLKSIYQAIKPGGELIIVDFERIPGQSRDWILGHVRAGKATVREEIQQSGFEFVEEKEIPGLDENYFIRFKK